MNMSPAASAEMEVVISSAYPLSAVLTLPSWPSERPDTTFPVIVMVHGSGDLDRDENTKRLRINAFKELSGLAVRLGFATLRYDKRGVGGSGGDFFAAGLTDLIDDAAAAVAFAKMHPRIDPERVILLGHSEGCMIAPAVHERIPVQGMILLAPAAEPLAHTTAWQREQMYEDLRTMPGFSGWLLRLLRVENKIRKMNDDLIRLVQSSDEAVLRYKGRKINAKWMREHDAYDVRETLKKVTCPVLSVTGSKDVQVKPEHAHAVCALVDAPCEAAVIPDLTHVLRKTDAELRFHSILKDYKRQVKRPLDDELTDVIRRWLLGWLGR